MHTSLRTQSKVFLTAVALASALVASPVQAKDSCVSCQSIQNMEQRMSSLEKRVELLETNEIVYGPITVSHIHLYNQKQVAIVQPGQTIECDFNYKLDSSQQEFFHKNHLIVGLKGGAAQVCATHLYGVWNSTGKATFNLVAPLQEGEYEVRIAYREASTCEEAINTWNVLGDQPSSYATIGILRVQGAPVVN